MSRILRIVSLLTFCAFTAFTANADTFTYTFAAPQFTVGEVTPLLNRSPNVGAASFQASFVSSVPGRYQIIPFVANPLFSGNSLVSPTPPDLLTISFNMAVTQVQFVWAQEFPGRIDFTSAAGNATQNSADVGGIFQGGTFVFSSATPFTSFSLAAFGVTGGPVNLAIDNLTLTTPTANIPEPATILLLGTGLTALTRIRKRKV